MFFIICEFKFNILNGSEKLPFFFNFKLDHGAFGAKSACLSIQI